MKKMDGSGALAIRYALSALKNVGGPAMEVLEQERNCKRAVLRFV